MFSCSGSGFSFICIGREQLLSFSLFVAIGAIVGVSIDHILIFLILMRFHRLWYLHFLFSGAFLSQSQLSAHCHKWNY